MQIVSDYCSDARQKADYFKKMAQVSPSELKECIRDKQGGCFSRDGKRLLAFENKEANQYAVPDGVEVICEDAFLDCKSLVFITMPESLTIIGNSAFEHSGVVFLTIPDGVIALCNSAFSNCDDLQSCSLPTHLNFLGAAAFAGCHQLHQLIFPSQLRYISGNPFADSPIDHLVSISEAFRVVDDQLQTADGRYLIAYLGHEKKVVLPEELTCICDSAFAFANELETITVPSTVERIEPNAFSYCVHLAHVDLPSTLKEISDLVFYNCKGLREIHLPEGVERIGRHSFESCNRLKEILIPNSVKEIGDQAFYNCLGLKQIIIGKSLCDVGSHPFCGVNLNRMVCHSSHFKFSHHAFLSKDGAVFYGLCSDLKQYIVPNGVVEIRSMAFCNRRTLVSLVLPDSVETIGKSAIANCSNLMTFKSGKNLREIGESAFLDCWSLNLMDLGACPQVIAKDALYNIYLLEQDGNMVYTINDQLRITVPRGSKSRLSKLIPEYSRQIVLKSQGC
jgi:hypothetical protein